MSETVPKDGVNISINNSDSNQGGGGGGFIDRIFDLGLRLLVPLLLVFAVFSIIIFFGVVLPLLNEFGGVIAPLASIALPFVSPIGAIVALAGGFLGALTGRR